jgi:hypothetical protein
MGARGTDKTDARDHQAEPTAPLPGKTTLMPARHEGKPATEQVKDIVNDGLKQVKETVVEGEALLRSKIQKKDKSEVDKAVAKARAENDADPSLLDTGARQLEKDIHDVDHWTKEALHRKKLERGHEPSDTDPKPTDRAHQQVSDAVDFAQRQFREAELHAVTGKRVPKK